MCEVCGKAFRHVKNKELHVKRCVVYNTTASVSLCDSEIVIDILLNRLFTMSLAKLTKQCDSKEMLTKK